MRQNDGATSLGDLGGKPLTPGVFSGWVVGQALGRGPSSITVRKYLVFTKCCDKGSNRCQLMEPQASPLSSLDLRTSLFPEKFPTVTQRLVPPVQPLFCHSQ